METVNEKSGAPETPDPPRTAREQAMNITYTSLNTIKVKLGQLLLDSQIIEQEELHQALKIAKESKEPIGKVLLTLSYIEERSLQSALLAQSLIAEGVMDQTVATQALRTAATQGIPLAEALEVSENAAKAVAPTSELDALLVQSKLITEDVHEQALKKSREERIPIGRALVLMSCITFKHLSAALACVGLIRTGRITHEEAVQALSEIQRSGSDLEVAFKKQRVATDSTVTRIKLGEILTASRFIDERESLAAVERALLEKRLLGDVLAESGLVSRDLIQVALTLQTLTARGVVSSEDAVKALRRVKDENRSFNDIADDMGLFKDDPDIAADVLDLLYKAGLAKPSDVPTAVSKQTKFRMDGLKALVASSCISDVTYQAALVARSMIKSGTLTFEQAVIALQMCERNRCSLTETLTDMGLKPKSDTASEQVEAGAELTPPPPEVSKTAPTWSSYPESKFMVTNLLVGAIVMWILVEKCPESAKIPAICTVLFIVSVIQFALGRAKEHNEVQRKRALKARIESSKESIKRLGDRGTGAPS